MTKSEYRDLASELIGMVGGMPSQEQCVDMAKAINYDPEEDCDPDMIWDTILELSPDLGA